VTEFVDRRARMIAADPTVNVAVEASAGTGKTRVLVDRYVRLVAEGVSPRHILAITFTRKAAGEMKSRIVDELRGREDLWAQIRSRLFEIHITTIDAFCLGLLREFPLEAGLDPDVELIDQVDAERLLEDAIDDVESEARRGSVADYRFLVARFGDAALRRGARDFLRSRLVKADLLDRYVERGLHTDIDPRSSLRRFSESMERAFSGDRGLTSFLDSGPDEDGRERSRGFRALAFALERAMSPDRIGPADVEEVAGYFLTKSGDPRRRVHASVSREMFRDQEAYEDHRNRIVALAPSIARAYRQWLREKDAYAVRQLHRFYRATADRFARSKRARSGLDFTDILLTAVQLLERRGEFSQSRFRLESRYHHLLIDEFQDTNEVQWRLVRALIESWGEGSGLVQESILAEQAAGTGEGHVREPSLFLVGDRKQSIYGFRDARVEVFETAARHLLRIRQGGGRRLTLRHSFRASGELLRFQNEVFSELPKVRSDLDWSFQYRDEDHFPVVDSDSKSRPVAVASARDLGEAAASVADEIVRVLEEEGRRPKDVAILFRSRTSYRAYEKALAARSVPTYVYRGLGFFDSHEVRDIQALVRFLAEPTSALRAAELARSRFVALSDTALARIASARTFEPGTAIQSVFLGVGAEIETTPPLPSVDRSRLERARRFVPSWAERVDRQSPSELIERAIDESDYARWFRDDDQSWENLKKILELVRRAENRGFLTMSRLSEYLAKASTEEDSPAILEAVDAVNLMTIHASKGLEFDTVCVVNLHQNTRQDTSLPRVRELADGRVEVNAVRVGGPEEDAQRESEPNRVEEEEKRLLYVAFTRARRNLVLSTVVDDEETSESRKGFVQLLPESLQEVLRSAAWRDESEIAWHDHRLRNLKPRRERHTYSEQRPQPPYRPRRGVSVSASASASTSTAARSIPSRVTPSSDTATHRTTAQALSRWPEAGSLLSKGRLYEDVKITVASGATRTRMTLPIVIASDDTVIVVSAIEREPSQSDRLRLQRMVNAASVAFSTRRIRGILLSTVAEALDLAPTRDPVDETAGPDGALPSY
jgi:ATP-dependent helicase/nuclease subunit A